MNNFSQFTLHNLDLQFTDDFLPENKSILSIFNDEDLTSSNKTLSLDWNDYLNADYLPRNYFNGNLIEPIKQTYELSENEVNFYEKKEKNSKEETNYSDINQSNSNSIASQTKKTQENQQDFKISHPIFSINKSVKSSQMSKKIESAFNKFELKSKKIKKIPKSAEKLKNITKNYGKNCAIFSISKFGYSFVNEVLSNDEILQYYEFIKERIPSLTNIANFRNMLLPNETDSIQIIKFKKAFQHISIIYIRDFAHNWIFHSSRIRDVQGHIFARAKMLRRVKDPKNFTNLH